MIGIFKILFLTSAVLAERDARWFSRETNTVTKVVRQHQLITEYTPSSCVVVQTSLPACRHLRSAPVQHVDTIKPTNTQRIMETAWASQKKPEPQGWRPILQPSDPLPPPTARNTTKATPPMAAPNKTKGGWGWDFFNFGTSEVTITQTLRELHTTKYMDPNTVVTFSVKGCRPSRLPFDLPECEPPRAIPLEPPEPEVPESGVIVMAPIQFVPGMSPVNMPLQTPIKPAPVQSTDEKKVETSTENVRKEEGKKADE